MRQSKFLPKFIFLYTLHAALALSQDNCTANCQLHGDDWARLIAWSTMTVNTTITAATVFQVVNTESNTTRLSTVYNDLPPGHQLPTDTNEQGTRTHQVTYTSAGEVLTTTIAFPTAFFIFPTTYHWSGTLSTTDSNGNSACVTTNYSAFVAEEHRSPEALSTPTHTAGPDPGGLLFAPDTRAIGFNSTLFPSEAALTSCRTSPSLPAIASYTARYITDTSVITEGGSSKPTSQTSAPTKSVPQAHTPAATTKSALTTTSNIPHDSTTVGESSKVTQASNKPSDSTTVIGTSEVNHESDSSIGTTRSAQATISSGSSRPETSQQTPPISHEPSTAVQTAPSTRVIVSSNPDETTTIVQIISVTSTPNSAVQATDSVRTEVTNGANGPSTFVVTTDIPPASSSNAERTESIQTVVSEGSNGPTTYMVTTDVTFESIPTVDTTQSIQTVVSGGPDGTTTSLETIAVTSASDTAVQTMLNVGSGVRSQGMLTMVSLGIILMLW